MGLRDLWRRPKPPVNPEDDVAAFATATVRAATRKRTRQPLPPQPPQAPQPAPRALVRISTGEYDFEIVGESHYQTAIAAAIGGWPHNHHIDRIRQEFIARVECEPTNPVDRNAVRVTSLDGATLGYFRRTVALEYAPLLAQIGESADFEVEAIVAARWIGSRWNGGVWLAMATPDEIVTAIREYYKT